ncbi:alpha/beta fold hydrolase [Pyxidicoccus sp. MSG2]|uniref:S9 family peptidase n=1 Tax=Pyxidicoccus sp. MSG2 TaxID=2996790 RepID=UPI0022718FEF|nr:alpha/beta fold hydrolase [Pyxidicoccus sp. MSG2]MCY1019958.1 alpha/beta fold hydrolase [Pyxidicoccus sp. MSG2]
MPSWQAVSLALTALALVPTLAPAAPRPPVTRPSKQYTIEQFMETTDVFGASFSPDEKRVLFTSNPTGVFNVFSVPVTGGKPTQLTHSTTDATFAVGYFPKDERVLFTRDQAGNGLTHLYVRTPDGKETDLTPGDKVRAGFQGWSHDGSAFYVSSNARDERFMDLYRHDTKTYAGTLVFQNDDGFDLGKVSPDGQRLSLEKSRSLSDSDVHLYDFGTKEVKHLTPHQGDASWKTATFAPDSSAMYLLTNEGSEFTRVVRYVLATGKREEMEKADWDITSMAFSRNGAWRVTGINEHGRALLRVHDVKAGRPLAVKLPEGSISDVELARGGKRMAFHLTDDRAPNNLYVFDFGTKKATRLTDTLSPAIDAKDLVVAEVVRYTSFDGLEIPSILYKPLQATPQNKLPAVVWVHGGPGDQAYRGYISFIQYLVNAGYVVLAPNNRGSSGYGKAFVTADDKKHGKEPLRDVVEAKKYLTGLPYVDGSRVGVLGASYGGYMALAALAFHPDTFDVGVDAFGPSDWVSMLKNIPPYWESFRQAMYQELGNPDTEAEQLRAISPAFHAYTIRKPLLVIQGANDPKVLKAQSDQMVEAVKKNNVPVDYLVLPDEGHGFSSKKSELESSTRIRTFLDTYLKQSPATARPAN